MMDATLVRRVCALLPMLGSASDGEIVNTAQTLSRILRESGCGWADLVAKLMPEPPAAPVSVPSVGSHGARRQRSAWAEDRDDVQQACEANTGGLDPWSEEFLASVEDQVLHQGRTLSEKQRTKLNEILDKLGV